MSEPRIGLALGGGSARGLAHIPVLEVFDELGLKPEWFGEYDGLKLRQHPQRIAVRLGGNEAVVFVPERADVSFRRFVGSE